MRLPLHENLIFEHVVKVCKSLKNRKARDELGLVHELFKPPYAGNDVYLSLSKMFSEIKHHLRIPTFFEKMLITSIYKNRGLKSDLSNERGIFKVAKLRSMLDKIL
jgi:hypothetical protein